MNYFEMEKSLKRDRDFGCFCMGCLSVLLISKISFYLSHVTDILINPDILVLYLPLLYTVCIVWLLKNFINDTIIPDEMFVKGMGCMFVLNIFNKIVIPAYLGFGYVDNLGDYISYYFVVYVVATLTYFFGLMIVYFFESIRFKYIQLRNGEFDAIIEQNNKALEEEKLRREEEKLKKEEAKKENKNSKNKTEKIDKNIKETENADNSESVEQEDLFDVAGGFIKRLSSKIEDNIKK